MVVLLGLDILGLFPVTSAGRDTAAFDCSGCTLCLTVDSLDTLVSGMSRLV